MTIFKLPDLGEGLPDAEIAEWHVKVGDVVTLDQLLVSMETAKAVVEVPSPFAGRVVKLYGGKGDVIQTGSPLIEFEAQGNASAAATATATGTASTANAENGADAATVAGKLEVGTTLFKEAASIPSLNRARMGANQVKATPAIRALAHQLNVDLSVVVPSGPNQTISRQDVEKAAKGGVEGSAERVAAGGVTGIVAEDLEPLRGTRRVMSQIMTQSHAEVVPVTLMEDAKLLHWSENEDVTVRLIKAIVAAVAKEPALNAWFDSLKMGRKLNKELHLGLAMDTAEGLFVPVIRNAEKLSNAELRAKINELKKQVSERTIPPEDLRGATLTLSNFGKFAGRYASPIVVPPMVAILGAGKLRQEVIAHEGSPKVSKVLPLALTFDHRAVTGGEATRFLGIVIEELEKSTG